MRIGSGSGYLVLARSDRSEDPAPWTIEARASSLDFELLARHAGVFPEADDRTVRDFEKFAEHQSQSTQVSLTEEGWLRFSRDARGYIEVEYRLSALGARAATEGATTVDGEEANEFCRQFLELLRNSR